MRRQPPGQSRSHGADQTPWIARAVLYHYFGQPVSASPSVLPRLHGHGACKLRLATTPSCSELITINVDRPTTYAHQQLQWCTTRSALQCGQRTNKW